MVVIQQMLAEGYVNYEYAEYRLYIVNIVRRGI